VERKRGSIYISLFCGEKDKAHLYHCVNNVNHHKISQVLGRRLIESSLLMSAEISMDKSVSGTMFT
jgi:hypothetical protein